MEKTKIEVPKELFQDWIDSLHAFEYEVNRTSLTLEEMEKYLDEQEKKSKDN